MIEYILKSSLSLLLLFGLYWFLLRKEKVFIFIRYFLLFSILLSLVLPFISIPLNIQTNEAKKNIITLLNGNLPSLNYKQNPIADLSEPQYLEEDSLAKSLSDQISFSQILLILYILGLILSLFRFSKNFFNINRQIKLSERINFSGRKLVLIDNQINPYCFFNTIFVCKHDFLNNKIAKEFLAHELEHIRQSHSTDIVLLELIRIVYWFNPILYLYSRAIRVNHEYLADSGVLKDSPDIEVYMDKLLSLISYRETIPLTSGLNQSLLRRRLVMITKPKSKSINIGLRITFTLCMLLIFFLFLSFKPTSYQPLSSRGSLDSILNNKKPMFSDISLITENSQAIDTAWERVKILNANSFYLASSKGVNILVGEVIVTYGDIEIKADSISINRKTNQLFASGRVNKSGEIIGRPIFKEGNQEFEADELTYNLVTRRSTVKNIKGQVDLVRKDSSSLVNSPTHKQIVKSNDSASNPNGDEDVSSPTYTRKPELFPIKKNESTETNRNFGEKNENSNISDFLFLNSEQLKPLGIVLNKNGMFYKNLNPNWKEDRVRYSGLSFYCTSSNYLTSKHYSETDVIKVKNRNERLLGKMEITRNDFYPVLIGNSKGRQSLDNETLSKDLKLFPVAICMSETKLQNRKDTIVVWFKPSESLKKVLPENVNIEDYLQLPVKTK